MDKDYQKNSGDHYSKED